MNPTTQMLDGSSPEIIIYGGEVVGRISDGYLKKYVHSSRHMNRNPQGWTWENQALEKAESLGIERTKIYDDDSGLIYIASIADFRRCGIRVNHGIGSLICLPMRYWRISPGLGNIPQRRTPW